MRSELWRNSNGSPSASGLKPGCEPHGPRGRDGRPTKIDARNNSMARALLEDPNASIAAICETLHVSRATLYRHLERCGHMNMTRYTPSQNQELHNSNARAALYMHGLGEKSIMIGRSFRDECPSDAEMPCPGA